MNLGEFLGKEIRLLWSNHEAGKTKYIDGVFHGVDSGIVMIEVKGSVTLIPLTSVRFISVK